MLHPSVMFYGSGCPAARLFDRIARVFQSLPNSSFGGLRTVHHRSAGSFCAMFDGLTRFSRRLIDGFAGFF